MTGGHVPPVLVTGATGRVGASVVDRTAGRGRAGARAHAATGGGGVAGGRRGRRGRSHRARIARRRRCRASVRSSSSGPPRRPPLQPSSSVSRRTRGASSFSPRRTKRRTRSSSSRTPWLCLHADIERLIAAAGLASTIIRPGMFASNALLWWAAAIRDGDVVRWPYGAAETAPIDERDIAAVAARALYEDGHAGGDYVLTGPESLSQAEQVSIIGDAIGRRIRFEELSPDEFRRETAGSWPGPVVDMLLAAWGATMGSRRS